MKSEQNLDSASWKLFQDNGMISTFSGLQPPLYETMTLNEYYKNKRIKLIINASLHFT